MNERRARIENLDALPFPDPKALVHIEQYPATALGAIMTMRGCPFRCTYCATSGVWGHKITFRSPRNEADDTFTIRRERVSELCRLMRSGLPGIALSCKTRADGVDERVAGETVEQITGGPS